MRSIGLYIIDIFALLIVFFIYVLLKPDDPFNLLDRYLGAFLLFLAIWLIISFFLKKYDITERSQLPETLKQIVFCNILILGIITSLMYILRIAHYSRFIVLGTIITTTAVELIIRTFYFWLRFAKVQNGTIALEPSNKFRDSLLRGALSTLQKQPKRKKLKKEAVKQKLKSREEAVLVEVNNEAFDFIFSYAKIDSPNTLIISTTSRFNLVTQLQDGFDSIVNLRRINDIRYLNKFFESANEKLQEEGLYINYVETKNLRKKRILRKFPPGLNYIFYTLDYIVKRIFPKFIITKKIYFFLTRGNNRVLTKAETFGRLYSCGFEIIAEKNIEDNLYFVARKIREPLYPTNPTYGPFVKLRRYGKNGKMINVFKMRTMHPYSEFLQDYIYKKEGLQEGGKFKGDFRISTIGRFMRTFWLDELPMLINLLQGDLKIVGVRPLSKHYFSLYTKELQQRRIKYKPGLIPPFYADNPKTLKEIMASERKYLDSYDKHPLRTDLRYFFIAVSNIMFKKYRSK